MTPEFPDMTPEQSEFAKLLSDLIMSVPPEEQEEALAMVLGAIVADLPTEALQEIRTEINASGIPLDHPFVVVALNMIEGQLALREIRGSDGE